MGNKEGMCTTKAIENLGSPPNVSIVPRKPFTSNMSDVGMKHKPV